MDIHRKGSTIVLDLNAEDAKGLFAVLTGQHQTVTPEQLQKGSQIYTWFFENVGHLAGAKPTEK